MSYSLANELQTAVPYAEQSPAIARELDDRWSVAWALRLLAAAALDRKDYLGAKALHDEGIELTRELGDRRHLAATLWHSGWSLHDQGEWDDAYRRYRESLTLAAEVGDRFLAAAVVMSVAGLHVSRGNFERALGPAAAAGAGFDEIGAGVPPVYQALFDRWLEPARRSAAEDSPGHVTRVDRVMTLEEATASGLAD